MIVILGATAPEVTGSSTPIAGVTGLIIGVVVRVVAIVVVFIWLTILAWISSTEFGDVILSVAFVTMHLPAGSIMMEFALVAFWKVSSIGSPGCWCNRGRGRMNSNNMLLP